MGLQDCLADPNSAESIVLQQILLGRGLSHLHSFLIFAWLFELLFRVPPTLIGDISPPISPPLPSPLHQLLLSSLSSLFSAVFSLISHLSSNFISPLLSHPPVASPLLPSPLIFKLVSGAADADRRHRGRQAPACGGAAATVRTERPCEHPSAMRN